jgi:hypothetical protein
MYTATKTGSKKRCTMVFDQMADTWVGNAQTEPLILKWKPEWTISEAQFEAMGTSK